MITKVIKRDGRLATFHKESILKAINNAYTSVYGEEHSQYSGEIDNIMNIIMDKLSSYDDNSKVNIEKIQSIIIKTLNKYNKEVFVEYSEYRNERNRIRNQKTDLMKAIKRIGIETDRDNANVGNNFSSKLLRIASEANKASNLGEMPKEMAKLHENGDLYFHDLDSLNLTPNCLHVPTGRILREGFNTGYGTLNPPKRIESAGELSCILLQSSQNK